MASIRTIHHLTRERTHNRWDRSLPPILRVPSGEVVEFETREASDNQVSPRSDVSAIENLNFDVIHPLTGPVFVEGALPGDTLQVDVVDIQHDGWGWTAQLAGFGLLADDFPKAYLHLWDLKRTDYAELQPGIRVPLAPFLGVMGLAWEADGAFSTIPPSAVGGNIDIKHLVAGASLLLPVRVAGALFSCGDAHAAQGDGEVCGTGIEAPMHCALRFTVRQDIAIKELQFVYPGGVRAYDSRRGYHVTCGVAPDLMEASKNAVRHMIEHLGKTYRLSPEEAYVLCSVAVDLHLSEVVDAPNWIVSAFLPLDLFQ
jgi:acetamidase/formamidase